MFEIHPWPDLPELEIPLLSPVFGSLLLVAGNGRDRGNALVWDPNGSYAPGPTGGYAWASIAHVRWGINNLEVYPAGGHGLQHARVRQLLRRGPAAPRIAGGDGRLGRRSVHGSLLGEWKLAGVILGIVQYSGQPAGTSFFGQRTYYADLAYYRPQLGDAVALPEPDRMLAPGAALLAWLGARRRRCAGAGAAPAAR